MIAIKLIQYSLLLLLPVSGFPQSKGTFERLIFSATGGASYISDFEDESFYDAFKLGPQFQSRLGWRQRISDSRVAIPLTFSWQFNRYKSDLDVNYGDVARLYPAGTDLGVIKSLTLHAPGFDAGMVFIIGWKEESTFDMHVGVNKVMAKMIVDRISIIDPVTGAYLVSEENITWDELGVRFELGFNIALSKIISLRWDFGMNMFGDSGETTTYYNVSKPWITYEVKIPDTFNMYSNLGLMIGFLPK